MRANLGAAIVLAVGIIAASVLVGGIYELHTAPQNAAFIWRINRFTGSMVLCSPLQVGSRGDTFQPSCFEVPAQKSS
jgi:hypothetical protein